MSKRPGSDDYHHQPPHKKHSHGPPPRRNQSSGTSQQYSSLSILPNPLPPLPRLTPELSAGPFIHKSAGVAGNYSRTTAAKDMSYERLEFLGDAYIELFASKLIFERYQSLPAGQMSQLRELLVKNETLAEYSRAYAFDKRIEVDSFRHMEAAASKGNKGLNKILGDVFEAYIAAVVLSDGESGYAIAEKWSVALWMPRLVAWEEANNMAAYGTVTTSDERQDPRKIFNPDAKQELSRLLIWSSKEVRIIYEPWKDMVELKGAQIGQTRHYIAVYMTGYGFEKKLLGKGEGKNRGEAGQWAATDAMHGAMKDFVAERARECTDIKEKRKQQESKG